MKQQRQIDRQQCQRLVEWLIHQRRMSRLQALKWIVRNNPRFPVRKS
jgi:hypothetical protein